MIVSCEKVRAMMMSTIRSRFRAPSAMVSRLPSWMSAGCEVDRVTAELEHADLERHPRPQRRLLEYHRQRLALQQLPL